VSTGMHFHHSVLHAVPGVPSTDQRISPLAGILHSCLTKRSSRQHLEALQTELPIHFDVLLATRSKQPDKLVELLQRPPVDAHIWHESVLCMPRQGTSVCNIGRRQNTRHPLTSRLPVDALHHSTRESSFPLFGQAEDVIQEHIAVNVLPVRDTCD
jgi:hypothetical protein